MIVTCNVVLMVMAVAWTAAVLLFAFRWVRSVVQEGWEFQPARCRWVRRRPD